MEFPFNINKLFHREITVLDNRLMLYVQKCRHGLSSGEAYKQLCSVINKMGEASAKAQGLGAVITTDRKLEFSDHRLYVMKDAQRNDGRGAVVGILKVGPKRLFVYDRQGNQHEVDAECVLDFYVHESCQRTGFGKKVFEFMLETESVKAQHLAIDRPSHKFSTFLGKHYGLQAPIPQRNNFAVFDGFFKDRPGSTTKPKGKSTLHLYKGPNTNTVRRHPAIEALWEAADGRQSSLSNSEVPLTDLEKEKQMLKDIQVPRSDSQDNISAIGIGPLQRTNSLNYDLSNLAMDDRRGYAAQGSRYSRYETTATPPRPDSGQTPAATKLGHGATPISTGQNNPPATNRRGSSPPLLRRDGPSRDYLAMNAQRDYLSLQGHLRLTPGTLGAPVSTINSKGRTPTHGAGGDAVTSPLAGASNPNQKVSNAKTPQLNDFKNDSSWTVFGVPSSNSAKKYQRTKLW